MSICVQDNLSCLRSIIDQNQRIIDLLEEITSYIKPRMVLYNNSLTASESTTAGCIMQSLDDTDTAILK